MSDFRSLTELRDLSLIKSEKGALVVAEYGEHVPFQVERVYFIFDVPSQTERGFHAHKMLQQMAICIQGSCVIRMIDKDIDDVVLLENPTKGLFIGPMVWHEMTNFSEDCILMVLASNRYQEDDYIRDYETYIKEVSNA